MDTRNSNSRSLVLTQTELARMPGTDNFHLTNKSFSALLVYITKKEEIDKKSSNIVKFRINKCKYDAMKEDLESGKLKADDVWFEFGKKLGLEGYISQQKREEVDEEMDVEENKKSNVEEEGEKKEAIVKGEKEEAMEQSSAKQCSEEEMLSSVCVETSLAQNLNVLLNKVYLLESMMYCWFIYDCIPAIIEAI